LIAADEPTVMAKPLLDPIVVENGQGDGGLADSASPHEGDWNKALGELVASEAGSWWWGWRFS